MNSFLLEIVTPTRVAFSKEVDYVSVPTLDGVIGVLAHHVPLFTVLTQGEVKIVEGKNESYLAIGSGFMEVTRNGTTILVSSAFHADELNETQIHKAQEEAKRILAEVRSGGAMKKDVLIEAEAQLRRSDLHLQIAKRRSHKVQSFTN